MADYVFNRVSVAEPFARLEPAQKELKKLLSALAKLDATATDKLPTFRIFQDPWLIPLVSAADRNHALGEVVQTLYDVGEHDAADYFNALNSMSPADAGLADEEIDALLRLELNAPAQGHEACFERAVDAQVDATLCAVTGNLLISLSRDGRWALDHLAFASGGRDYHLDHVSEVEHADSIQARRVAQAQKALTPRSFWESRFVLFPRLKFGQAVQGQLAEFDGGLFGLLFRRLVDLNRRAEIWQSTGIFPNLRPEITGESASTMARYPGSRDFPNSEGYSVTFEDHIWVDSLFRIHLLRSAAARTIEIGYIGRHLKTVKFPT